MCLSHDAIIFGLGFLSGPGHTLSFGGDGAQNEMTDRARSALNELLGASYAEVAAPSDGIPNREYYRGVRCDPHLGTLARQAGIDPFALERWAAFQRVSHATRVDSGRDHG